MLSYRHSFHAGNHADVLKHTVPEPDHRVAKEKKNRFSIWTRTRARGVISWAANMLNVPEYLEGIAHLAAGRPARRTGTVYWRRKHFNRSGRLRCHPGSPLIARQLLREQDSLQLTGTSQRLPHCCARSFKRQPRPCGTR